MHTKWKAPNPHARRLSTGRWRWGSCSFLPHWWAVLLPVSPWDIGSHRRRPNSCRAVHRLHAWLLRILLQDLDWCLWIQRQGCKWFSVSLERSWYWDGVPGGGWFWQPFTWPPARLLAVNKVAGLWSSVSFETKNQARVCYGQQKLSWRSHGRWNTKVYPACEIEFWTFQSLGGGLRGWSLVQYSSGDKTQGLVCYGSAEVKDPTAIETQNFYPAHEKEIPYFGNLDFETTGCSKIIGASSNFYPSPSPTPQKKFTGMP